MQGPNVPLGMENGFYTSSNEAGEVVLHAIKDKKSVMAKNLNSTNLEFLIFSILKAAHSAYCKKLRKSPNQPTTVPALSIPVSRIGISGNQLPGHETLHIVVGDVRLGFQVPHEYLETLGRAFLAASVAANPKKT